MSVDKGFGNGFGCVFGVVVAVAILAGCHADKAPTQSGGYPLLADVYMPNISVYSPVQTEIARTGTVRFNFPPEEHNVVFTDRVAVFLIIWSHEVAGSYRNIWIA